MKNLVYVFVAALCVIVGCSREEMTERLSVPKSSIQASFEQGKSQSRLAVGEKNSLTWTTGDAFMIFDNSKSYEWTLEGEGGESTGTFAGEIPTGKLIGASYPASQNMTVANNKLTMELADELKYDANGKCNLPMWGTMTSLEKGVKFCHLGALLKINFQDIPAGYNTLAVKADKPLSGTFVADLSLANPVLVASSTEEEGNLTVTFDPFEDNDKDCIFYIPLPVGTYNRIEITVSKEGNNEISVASWNGKTIERAKVYLASVTYKVVDGSEPSAVSKVLEGLNEELPNVQVTVSGKIQAASGEAIEIPVVEDAKTNVKLEFEQIPGTTDDTPLVIKEKNAGDESYSSNNELTISIPVAESPTYMEVKTPTTTVNVESGKFGKLVATTALNTLVLGEVEVEELEIKGGNVRLNASSEIGKIENTSDEEILLILDEGASSENIKEDLPENVSMVKRIANKELSVALYQTLGAEVVTLDSNGYALMKEKDMSDVTALSFFGEKEEISITSLAGIENFINLETLVCGRSGLMECDLSQNKKLVSVSLFDNPFTTLDLSENTALEYVDVKGSSLIELDLSQNTSLTTLICTNSTQLANLNVSNLTNLVSLSVRGTALTQLNIPNPEKIYELQYGSTKLSLNLRSFTGLKYLGCDGLKLSSIDLTAETKKQLIHLTCDNNNLSALDLTEYPNLTALYCSNNSLKELDLAAVLNLRSLYCNGNNIESLDASMLNGLQYLACGNQKQGVLNLTLSEIQMTSWNKTWKNNGNQNVKLAEVGEEEGEMSGPEVTTLEELQIALVDKTVTSVILTAPLTISEHLSLYEKTLYVSEKVWESADAAITLENRCGVTNGKIIGSTTTSGKYLIKSDVGLELQAITLNAKGSLHAVYVANSNLDLYHSSITAETGYAMDLCAKTMQVQAFIAGSNASVKGNVHYLADYSGELPCCIIAESGGTVTGDLFVEGTYANELSVEIIENNGSFVGKGWMSQMIAWYQNYFYQHDRVHADEKELVLENDEVVIFTINNAAQDAGFVVGKISGSGTIRIVQEARSSTPMNIHVEIKDLGENIKLEFDGNFRKIMEIYTNRVKEFFEMANGADHINVHLTGDTKISEPITLNSGLTYNVNMEQGIALLDLNGYTVTWTAPIIVKGGILIVGSHEDAKGTIQASCEFIQAGAAADDDGNKISINIDEGIAINNSSTTWIYLNGPNSDCSGNKHVQISLPFIEEQDTRKSKVHLGTGYEFTVYEEGNLVSGNVDI